MTRKPEDDAFFEYNGPHGALVMIAFMVCMTLLLGTCMVTKSYPPLNTAKPQHCICVDTHP